MADLGVFGPLGGALILYFGIGRRIVYSLYMMAGAVLLAREGRQFSEAEARDYGRTLVWKTVADFIVLRWTAIDWLAIGAGATHFVDQFGFHMHAAVRGWKRDMRKAREWCAALFKDRGAERIAIGHERFEEAGIRRAALFNSEAYDFESIVWDGLPVDPDHARARDEYEHLARKPRLTSGEGSQLALVLLSLQNYGDNPLAVRRGGVSSATVAPQGFLAAGTAIAAVTGGWAWIAPRALVALAIALVVVGLQWRNADDRADALELAQTKLKSEYAAAAKSLDAAYARVEDTAKGCLAQIEDMRAKAQTARVAEAAERKRRQARAQAQAAAGGAPDVPSGADWMRDIIGGRPSEPSPAPAAPGPGVVSDGSAGPAPAAHPGDVPSDEGGPVSGSR